MRTRLHLFSDIRFINAHTCPAKALASGYSNETLSTSPSAPVGSVDSPGLHSEFLSSRINQ